MLEHSFSSQSFLQYCQDEPPLKPRFDAAAEKTDWSNCQQALSWLKPLDRTCSWHREVFDGRNTWSWKVPDWIKLLSHVGGYLGDYMMTEYRSRAFQPMKCSFVKNWVYFTLYEEMAHAKRLGPAASQLLHDMDTN